MSTGIGHCPSYHNAYVALFLLVAIGGVFVYRYLHLSPAIQPYIPILKGHGNIVLLGDSLIHRTCLEHNLIDLLRSRTDDKFTLNFIDAGVNANMILDISQRLAPILNNIRNTRLPSFVFLLWDSDAADIDESLLSQGEVKSLRARYARTLHFVLKQLTRTEAQVVVSGPVLYGKEGKTKALNDYRDINRKMCKDISVEYVDLRSIFLQREAEGMQTTSDGEHFNAAGAEILANQIAKLISRWQAYL